MVQIKPVCPYLKKIVDQHKLSKKNHKKCERDCYVPNSQKCNFVLSLEEATLFMVSQHICGICCGKYFNPKYSTPMAKSEGLTFDASRGDHFILQKQSEIMHSVFPNHQMSAIVNTIAREKNNACKVFEKMVQFETKSIGNLKKMLEEVLKDAGNDEGRIENYVKFCIDHEDQYGCLIAQAIREQMMPAMADRYWNEIVLIFKIIDKLVTNSKTYGASFTFDIPNWYGYAYQNCSEATKEFLVKLRQNWDSILPRATIQKIDSVSEIMKQIKTPKTNSTSNVDGNTDLLKENENKKTGNPENDDS